MFLKYKAKKGFCITECPFIMPKVGSCACKRCKFNKFHIVHILFLKIVCCSHKKKKESK
jgi:hypothetical protein